MMPPMVPMVLKIPNPVFTAGPCTSAGTLQAAACRHLPQEAAWLPGQVTMLHA